MVAEGIAWAFNHKASTGLSFPCCQGTIRRRREFNQHLCLYNLGCTIPGNFFYRKWVKVQLKSLQLNRRLKLHPFPRLRSELGVLNFYGNSRTSSRKGVFRLHYEYESSVLGCLILLCSMGPLIRMFRYLFLAFLPGA